ncbi:MAG: hypothetical protein ACE5OZ_12170, partial [Candidatus Heimdallarchaeota archaeon]
MNHNDVIGSSTDGINMPEASNSTVSNMGVLNDTSTFDSDGNLLQEEAAIEAAREKIELKTLKDLLEHKELRQEFGTVGRMDLPPHEAILVILEDYLIDLLETSQGCTLMQLLGLDNSILDLEVLRKTAAFTDPRNHHSNVFSHKKLDTNSDNFRSGWRYRTQVITLIELLLKKLPKAGIRVIKLGTSLDGQKLKVMTVEVNKLQNISNFRKFMDFIEKYGKIASKDGGSAYLEKAFGKSTIANEARFHFALMGGAMARALRKKVDLWYNVVRGTYKTVRKYNYHGNVSPSHIRPAKRVLTAEKEVEVVLNGVDGNPSLLDLLSYNLAILRYQRGPTYGDNVSKLFWRAVVSESLQHEYKFNPEKTLPIYALVSDQLNVLVNSGGLNGEQAHFISHLDSYSVRDGVRLDMEINKMLFRVRTQGLKLGINPHDDAELMLDLVSICVHPGRKGIGWHSESILSILLEYITETKLKRIIDHIKRLNKSRDPRDILHADIAMEIARILGDDGTHFREIGTIGKSDSWITDQLKIIELQSPGSPDKGKLIPIWISNKPAQTRSGDLTISTNNQLYKIANDLRKVTNAMKKKKELVVADKNIEHSRFNKIWGKGNWARQLLPNEKKLLIRLALAYENAEVVAEYAMFRWVAFEHTSEIYFRSSRGYWYEPSLQTLKNLDMCEHMAQ